MLTGQAMTQIASILEEIRGRRNLRVLASGLRLLAADLLDRTAITDPGDPRLYNAAVVRHEGLRLAVRTWQQPAWQSAPAHADVLDCLMHGLTCAALGEARMRAAAGAWLKAAVEQNRETRPHVLQPFRKQLLTADFTGPLLATLLDLRIRYDDLDDDLGPYPPESFPFHFFAPEAVLLDRPGPPPPRERALWPEVEELLVVLGTEL